MKIKLENGEKYIPNSKDPVECEIHNFRTTWGDLSNIQKLAIRDGLDTTGELPCILSNSYHRTSFGRIK